MSRNLERLIWLAALLTLLGVMGFNYYKAHEHDEALALIAYPPTAYDTPIIPETAEEKERRIAGMEKIKTAPKGGPDALILEMFGTADPKYIEHYQEDFDRVQNYLSAQFLLNHPTSWGTPRADTVEQNTMYYLTIAMQEGYAPAHDLYKKRAPLDLKRGLKFFREEQYDEGWQLLLPLAAEGYPPAVKKVARITSLFIPLGHCADSYWFIPDAKKGDPYAMDRVVDMLRYAGMRHNNLLAYAWYVKKNQLTGQNDPEPYLFDDLPEHDAQIVNDYALATPVHELPIGVPMLAPPTPILMYRTSRTRTARGGILCIEEGELNHPLGPPRKNLESPFGKDQYESWLDAINDPQD